MRSRACLRIGTVPFLVARPLDSGLEDEVELVCDVPARLVAKLREGELDVALVSSIELFRRPGYRYVDGLAVAGKGHVSSVQVFLRRPLAEVRTIALDPRSRAAASLVAVLLPDRELVEVGLDDDPREASADAWLRIGDEALREALVDDAPPVFNPSATWTEVTGLPFVFAAWIVRPGVDVEPLLTALARARARGASRIEELATEAATRWSIPHAAARTYLAEECLFEPGAALRASLFEFRDRAARVGLCEPDLEPEAVEGLRVP